MVGEAERRERFGYALQQALAERGISERQLAGQMELDPRKVAGWRTGKKLPDLYETQILAAKLRVSEELFRNPPPVPKPPVYPIREYLLETLEAREAVAARAIAEAPDEQDPAATPAARRRPRRQPA